VDFWRIREKYQSNYSFYWREQLSQNESDRRRNIRLTQRERYERRASVPKCKMPVRKRQEIKAMLFAARLLRLDQYRIAEDLILKIPESH